MRPGIVSGDEREMRVKKICARPQLNAEKKLFLRLHIVHNSHRFSLFPLIAVKQHQKKEIRSETTTSVGVNRARKSEVKKNFLFL